MKRIIKLMLFGLFIFLALPQNTKALQAEDTEQQNWDNRELERVILTLEQHIEEYIEVLENGELTDENKVVSLREYLTIKLKVENFTEEEIIKAFEKITEKRKEKIINFAKSYIIAHDSLSKRELMTRLETESFLEDEIQYAIEQINIDWKKQAKNAAEKYINRTVDFEEKSCTILSRKTMIRYLVEEKKFTREQATAGIKDAEIDWNEQAFKQAKYELNKETYSKIKLIEKLILDEFSREEAVHGINKTATNWKEQARKKAERYLETSLMSSKKELLKYLRQEGFTAEEAIYAAEIFFRKEMPKEKPMEEKQKLEDLKQPEPQSMTPSKTVDQNYVQYLPNPLTFVDKASQPGNEKQVIEFTDSEEKRIKKIQATGKRPKETMPETVKESEDENNETSLFDNPVFIPFIIAVIAGNLYLFQKM